MLAFSLWFDLFFFFGSQYSWYLIMGLETRGQVEMEHEKTGSPCKVGASGVLLPCPQARQVLPVETQQVSKES